MERKTMKRALSLFLAILMIALALPLTMLPTLAAEEETIDTTIKNAKMYATYSDGYALHVKYGSVKGMIDGDPYGAKSSNEQYPYFYSDPWAYCNTELYISSIGQTRTYYGYAVFELNGLSKLSDVTVWLAGDGVSGATNHWTNQLGWNMVDAYDILVSTDGETWTLMSEVTGLHTKFPSANATRAEKTSTGDGSYKIYGNKVAFGNATEAKYVAIAVSAPTNETAIVIGEVTVSGTTTASAVAEKTPAQKYAEAKDGTLLHTVNFKDPSWSDDYANASNHNSYYKLSEDGFSVEHAIDSDDFGTNLKYNRAIWGGIAENESFPLDNKNKYTLYFDVTFSQADDHTACGIQIDGTNTLLIDMKGNSACVIGWDKSTTKEIAELDESEKWTSKIGDKSVSATQKFAIEVNSETGEMTLYVADNNGTLNKVRTLTCDIQSAQALRCGIYVCRLGSGKPEGEDKESRNRATISNLQIYKGLVAERAATTIKNVKMFAMYDDEWALHPKYGSVEGMIDGDAYNTKRSKDSDWPYFYSSGGNDLPGAYPNTEIYINSIGETRAYYGYALFELDAMSTLSDVTVWLAADGNKPENVDRWRDPKYDWNMNNAYDILVSEDGETWTLMGEYDDMCGDGTNKGAGFPSKYDDDYAMKTVDGYLRVGHKAYLAGVTAKYVAVAVKECTNEAGNQIVIGEVTVTGLASSESTEKTPAEIFAEAEDGDLLKAINFNGTYWSDDYNNSDNWHDYYIITDGGNTVKHGLYDVTYYGNNNKRAMWGGLADGETFPLQNDNKYTVYFDVKFGGTNNTFGCGIQVDGVNSLVVDGVGNSYWYMWNTQRVGAPTDSGENWLNKTDKDASATQTFAIEVNPETEELTLYVADSSGLLNKVRTLTYEAGVDVDAEGNETPFKAAWIESTLTCGIYVRSLNGKVYSTSNAEFSNLRIYKGLTAGYIRNSVGASVRLDTPTGIRFKSQFRKDLIDSLRATYGEENVNIGMIITPTDYITANGVDFTMAALDACDAITGDKYVKITATAIHENELFYVINCALVNIKKGNYSRQFSARAFIEIDGEVYKYAEFNLKNNSRSIAEVAESAYNDVSPTQNGAYKNVITIGTGDIAVSYSPYTVDERAILGTFFDVEDPTSSISVMTYNIKGTDSDREKDRDITKAYSFIASSGVDVIGLQEDDDYNARDILALNSDYALATNGNSGNGNEDNAILYNKTKYNEVGSGMVYFKELVKSADVYKEVENITSTGPDYITKWNSDNFCNDFYAEGDEVTIKVDFGRDKTGSDKGRFFKWVVLEDKATGVKYLVVNTHIHYRCNYDGTLEGEDKSPNSVQNKLLRQAQLTLIKLWLENDATAKQYANSIVMGDLNTQHDSNAIGGLTKGGTMAQARDTAVMIGDDWGTLVEADANGKEYMERKKWIYDHVVYNSDALVAAKFTVIDNKLTGTDAAKANYPSDHLPVAAEFYYYN